MYELPLLVICGACTVAFSIPNARLEPYELVTMSLCLGNLGVATSGNVTDEAIAEYIRGQDGTEPSDGDDNFQVTPS